MLAVLPGLLKRWAGAVRRDALAAQADRNGIRIRIRTTDLALGRGLVHVDVLDDLALLVIEAAKESARSEQAAKAAVGKGGEGVS